MGFGLLLFFFSQSYVITKRFTKALKTSEELSLDLEMKVNDQTTEIRDLLDNTGQGILSFDENLIIQQHASRATYFIFEKSIHGDNILDVMFSETKNEIAETMEILFKSGGKMSLVKGLLPVEYERDEKLYKVAFRWIPAGKKSPNLVMVILTDVTIKRKLEKMLEKDEQRNQKIIQIAIDRHGFVRFYNYVQRSLNAITSELQKTITDIDVVELSRRYHTMKGGLSGYSFLDVASIAHRAEDILDNVIRDESSLTENNVVILQRFTEDIRNELKQDMVELGDLVPKQFLNAGNLGFYTISEDKINRLEQYLHEKLPNSTDLAERIRDLRKQPLRNLMKKITSDAKYIAFQRGKQVKVTFTGEDTQIIHSELEGFFNNIIHLIRNAVHHGIELPHKRKKLGKQETGVFSVDTVLKNGIFTMVFADDGSGIDVEELKERAIQSGFLTNAESQTINNNDALQLILLPGFSTKETSTTLSGRGIGMHSVASVVEDLGGTIGIESELGKGTTLTIVIPVTF